MGQNPLAFFANAFSGSLGGGRVDQQKSLWTNTRHGKYYASVYGTPAFGTTAAKAGSTFRGANPGASPVTLSAALATTYVGLCLSNPAGSTVNLAVKRVAGCIMIAPGAFLALGLITGWAAGGITTHTTSLSANIVNGYVGAAATGGSIVASAAQGLLDSACTLVGTPLWDRWFASSSASANGCPFNADLDDDLIIPPGGYAAIGADVAGPASGFLGSFMWEEIAP